MLGMGRIDAASLDHRSGVHRGNPASARANVNLSYRIADWSVALVRRKDSPRLPPASEALEGAGTFGEYFTCGINAGMPFRSTLVGNVAVVGPFGTELKCEAR